MPDRPAPERPLLLAIETSCDDTAAAVLADGRLLSSVVSSQRVHEGFGGVVPELASRAHQQLIVPVVEAALAEAGVEKGELDAVAATYGPGLMGSLLVGLNFGKALALGLGVPFVGVNHMEGHLYSVFLEDERPPLPYLALVVSGGHSMLVRVEEDFRHTVLGRTRDDAAGEAFDKVARMLGLGFPGGPAIDRLAATGDAAAFDLPRTRLESAHGPFDFSFSGVKTAVLYTLRDRAPKAEPERAAWIEAHAADLAASFQAAVVDVLVSAVRDAVARTGIREVAVVGGVSANRGLRAAAQAAAEADGFRLYVPPPKFSVDNAAMIGVTAHFQLRAGRTSPLSLSADPALALG